MYIVRFIRVDGAMVEDYYYKGFEDALSHLILFVEDDSNLYKQIQIIHSEMEDHVLISLPFRT